MSGRYLYSAQKASLQIFSIFFKSQHQVIQIFKMNFQWTKRACTGLYWNFFQGGVCANEKAFNATNTIFEQWVDPAPEKFSLSVAFDQFI